MCGAACRGVSGLFSWSVATDEWGNKFDNGETYELIYPTITIPEDAIYVVNQGYKIADPYDVRLESTIGIYGTGLLDAIDDADLKAQYAQEEEDGLLPNGLNTAFFGGGEWVSWVSARPA